MTRDDIIRMALEAGIPVRPGPQWTAIFEQFAALVAAAERERIAQEFDRRAVYADGTPSSGWYEPDEPARIIRARSSQ
jgi:hypothetical protein